MLQVEPCCWMTYTTHRDTQATLAILDKLDIETDKPTDEEIAKKFGFEDKYHSGEMTTWQHTKPKIWSLFDEPHSSHWAKVLLTLKLFLSKFHIFPILSWILVCNLILNLSGGFLHLCLLHSHFHPVLLPEDPPQLSGSRHPKCDGP